MQIITEHDYTLLEEITGQHGRACHWSHGAGALAELAEKGWPLSGSFWLVYLPADDYRSEQWDDDNGVYEIAAHSLDWLRQRFPNAHQGIPYSWGIEFKGTYNEDNTVDIHKPHDLDHDGYHLESLGAHSREAAIRLMRLWALMTVNGEWVPVDGLDEEEAHALMKAAEIEPDPQPTPAQPTLFDGLGT